MRRRHMESVTFSFVFRKPYHKLGAFAFFAFDFDRASMGFNYLL